MRFAGSRTAAARAVGLRRACGIDSEGDLAPVREATTCRSACSGRRVSSRSPGDRCGRSSLKLRRPRRLPRWTNHAQPDSLTAEPGSFGGRGRLAKLEPEITAGRTFHDRLGPGQLDIRIESLDQGPVTLARQTRARSASPSEQVHLGVTAARDVERKPLGDCSRISISGPRSPSICRGSARKPPWSRLPAHRASSPPLWRARSRIKGRTISSVRSAPISAAKARMSGPTIRDSISRWSRSGNL